MFKEWILGSLLLLVVVTSAAPNAREDDKNEYRLKKSFVPENYLIEMNIPKEVLDPEKNENVINNATTVITLNKPNSNDTEFEFHVDQDFIKFIKIEFEHNNNEKPVKIKEYDNKTKIAKIDLPDKITESTFTLSFTYDLTVSTSDMYGLYKSKYVGADNKEQYLLATQFESVYARRVFPCLDEPSFKATFELNIETGDKDYHILTNTEGDSKELEFTKSPKMSTYLVAIIVSKFDSTPNDTETVYKVWSRSDLANERKFAAENVPKILEALAETLKISYSESGLKKMDVVAIPDFDAGAMENWGLVTFRENALLYNEESSTAAKMRVLEVITHEFTHQWFGDLVTLDWWDVTFLNEGFANFFEYFITEKLYEEFQMDKQFIVKVQQNALEADSAPGAKALQSECNSKAEIQAKFDDISYDKGASIIKMVMNYLTEDTFLEGLNKYLNDNKFKNTRPEDLWKALQPDVPRNLTDVMKDWINEPGYPLLHVTYKNGKLTISQFKFTLDNTKKASSWKVPIEYKYYNKSSKAVNPIAHFIKNSTETIPLEDVEWIHLENTKGFYRVNYDEDLWEALITAIKDGSPSISDIDLSQIVDDLFALGRVNALTYAQVFKYIDFLKNSDNYFVWVPAFKGYDFLLKRFGDDSQLGKKIISTIAENMKTVKNDTKSSEDSDPDPDPVENLKKGLVYDWLCRIKDEETLKDAKNIFKEFIKDTTTNKIDVDLRSSVYCYGQEDDDDWNKLFKYYKEAKMAAEKDVVLKSLACTKNTTKLNELLEKSLENNEIRAQDGQTVFLSVLSHDVDTTLEFFVKHHDEISKKYSGLSLTTLVTSLADRLTTESQIKKLSNIKDIDESFKVVLESAIKVAEANLKWSKTAEKQLKDFYGLGDGANSINLSITCMFAVTLTFIYNLF